MIELRALSLGTHRITLTGLSLILGGAVGNLIDRLLRGAGPRGLRGILPERRLGRDGPRLVRRPRRSSGRHGDPGRGQELLAFVLVQTGHATHLLVGIPQPAQQVPHDARLVAGEPLVKQ